jgi:ribosomal-protein-alanine N-acetyltransferase
MSVRLRPMRWWDVERLLPVERALFGDTAWSAEAFWSELAHPRSRWYLVAESDAPDAPDGSDAVLGYAGLMVSGAEADVQTVAVAVAAQGRGTGALLVGALVAEAAARGATSLLLEVRADNPAAIALYVRHGFEQIAVRRRYYQPADVDALVLRLRPLPAAAAGPP